MTAHNGHTESVRVLVHAKADIDKARTNDGATPAFIAARSRNVESLQVLLQAAADVTRCLDYSGWSPLFAASAASCLIERRRWFTREPLPSADTGGDA